ncbi:MAG: hypothetical protein ACOX6X_08015 [Dethiobacteria bacterium]
MRQRPGQKPRPPGKKRSYTKKSNEKEKEFIELLETWQQIWLFFFKDIQGAFTAISLV